MRKVFEGLSTQEINQVRMYGTTEARMRESIERSTTFRFSGAEMIVAGMLSDAQEMFAYNRPEANTIEEHRQLMNRAKWALFDRFNNSSIKLALNAKMPVTVVQEQDRVHDVSNMTSQSQFNTTSFCA